MMKEVAIEFLGTMFFLYVVVATGSPLAIGAALALSLYIGGSGSNFNPAATLMLVLSGKQSMKMVAPYLIAQFAAAIAVACLWNRITK
jgi:glycerol uptake facilitator-like aquaporin